MGKSQIEKNQVKGKAVVLLSGGMDSAVTAALVREAGYQLAAVFLDYGQRTLEAELRSFHSICQYYGIEEKLVINCSHFQQIGGSALTDSKISVPTPEKDEFEEHNPVIKGGATASSEDDFRAPSTYVPFRNANILAMAVSYAEVIKASAVAVGAVAEDSSGYPDTRKSFFEAFEKTIETGTALRPAIKILTPVIDMSKSEIVENGARLGVPFELTHSCYQSNGKACGRCESCRYRLRGFEKAGLSDPLEYEA